MTAWFTAEKAALLLIDYQVGVLQLVRNIPSDASLRNGCKLAKAAVLLNMPIVMTSSQEDRIQGAVAPAMQAAASGAYGDRVKRQGIVNAWDDPSFRSAVEAMGRRQLIMGAITTDICLVFPQSAQYAKGMRCSPSSMPQDHRTTFPKKWRGVGWSARAFSYLRPTWSSPSWRRIGADPRVWN